MTYTKKVIEHFRNLPAFTISDLQVFLKGIKLQYLRLLIHNLMTRHGLNRIARGVYTFKNEIQIVGFGFKPFYYGLQDALSLRGLWEQETNAVVITPRKVRSGMRQFIGGNYLVRRINRKMFFGFEMIKYSDFWIPVSDNEKTLIDLIYFKEPVPKELLQHINKKKLREYLKRCPNRIAKMVKRL
jgi:predicted transcriptional regulator of viral defense system